MCNVQTKFQKGLVAMPLTTVAYNINECIMFASSMAQIHRADATSHRESHNASISSLIHSSIFVFSPSFFLKVLLQHLFAI
jgi:hypothetical protein